jgi:hypothetical protein
MFSQLFAAVRPFDVASYWVQILIALVAVTSA